MDVTEQKCENTRHGFQPYSLEYIPEENEVLDKMEAVNSFDEEGVIKIFDINEDLELSSPLPTQGSSSLRTYKDQPNSVDDLTFLLDCFVLSFGPEMPQLGRYHPDSDPERYAFKEEDEWSSHEEELLPVSPTPFPGRKSVHFDVDSMSGTVYTRPTRRANCCRSQPVRVSEAYPNAEFPDNNRLDEVSFPDEYLIRELSEMRVLLERLLEGRNLVEWNDVNELRGILSLLPDNALPSKEPTPHFPVGDLEFRECGICFESQWLYNRACCNFPACTSCLQQYYSLKVEQGLVKIECCNPTCQSYVHRDEISARVDPSMKEKFHRLLVIANENAYTKTCPRCNHVTKMDCSRSKKHGSLRRIPRVVCPACKLEWCFSCHAPWHALMSCKQFRKGDRLLKCWAKEKSFGEQNAQRCPKCKVYIQRTGGCDHMHCTRCKTDFCYRCGDRFRRLKFFGDHYSKLSVFGCKYRYKADRPIQRKLIRGAIFGSKVMAAPVLGTLAVCAGAIAVGVGVFALPVYGGVKLYRRCEARHQAKEAPCRLPHYSSQPLLT